MYVKRYTVTFRPVGLTKNLVYIVHNLCGADTNHISKSAYFCIACSFMQRKLIKCTSIVYYTKIPKKYVEFDEYLSIDIF